MSVFYQSPGTYPMSRHGRAAMLRSDGFTLMELIVVMALIGVMLGVAAPAVREALLTDALKRTARKMIGVINEARNDAVRTHQGQTLHLDLETHRFWKQSAGMSDEERSVARKQGFVLPGDVRILDVSLKGLGKNMAGETWIRLNKKGYIHPSAIHLGCQDGRRLTLILSPFLGKIKVMDKYLDFTW